MQVNSSLLQAIRNCMMYWSSILLPCSLTTNSYATMSDHLQFQEYAMLCHSCCLFFLALLFSRMIFPFLILKTLQNPIPTSSCRKSSLKLHAFLWTSRIRSKFRCPLRLIVFSFGKLLAQQVWVTPLKNRLMWCPGFVCCSFITRPFPYRIVHCYIVT